MTNRVANLLVTSILLALISGGVQFYNVRQKNTYTQLIMHTHQVIRKSSEMGSLLTNAEKYQREYISDRDSLELQRYRGSLPPIRRIYDTLLTLTSDNPVQTNFLKQRIKPLMNLFIVHMDREVDTAEDDPATLPALDDSIDITLKDLRSNLRELMEREDQLLLERTSQLRSIYVLNDSIHYASFVLIAVISAYALKALLDKEKKNKELLASLQDANRTLEANVQERTVDLEKKSSLAEKLNRDLQDNFDELQSFYETLHITNAKAEDTVKEMRDLYDNAPTGYHSLNADGLIVRINQTELRWLGYTRDEVVGKMNFTQIIAPDEHASYHSSFSSFLKDGYVRDKLHTFVRKDGSKFQALLNATAIYDENGKYVMSRGVTYSLGDLVI